MWPGGLTAKVQLSWLVAATEEEYGGMFDGMFDGMFNGIFNGMFDGEARGRY